MRKLQLIFQNKFSQIQKHVSLRLWDFAMKHEIELLDQMLNPQTRRTPEEELAGNTPDISDYLDFGFYDHV